MGKNAQMNIPLWADMPILLALMRAGSFDAAAHSLGIDRTTVARRLERVEKRLEIQLFDRASGRLKPTEEGRRILSAGERAEQELTDIQPDYGDKRFTHGKVRISLSEHILSAFSAQLFELITAHPDLFLEFTTSNRLVDLSRYEADIVIRISQHPQDAMHTVDLGPIPFGLYRRADSNGPILHFWASPGETTVPKHTLQAYPEASVIAAIDGVLATREMILSGDGVGVLPSFLGDQDERLKLISDKTIDSKYRLIVGCLPEQRNLHRIRTVMRYLSKRLVSSAEDAPETRA